MIRAVADTHAVLWYLYNDPRLSVQAGTFMDTALAAGDQIAISSITLAEMVYLIERNRIDAKALDRVQNVMNLSGATITEIPLDRTVVQMMRQVPRSQVPDLPDRIVAATAMHLGVPVISRDRKIKASVVLTIW
jgi:PIN domain nuclease of toxin-antitoxin system